MTVENLIVDAWEDLGEPSDLDPYTSGSFDITTAGAVQMLRWLNRAYRRVAAWKFPDGNLVRFKVFEKETFFKMAKGTGDVSAATSSTVTLGTISGLSGSSILTTADYLNEWVVEITAGTGNGQRRVITGFSNAGVASVAPDWDTTPDATSDFSVYKRFMKFLKTGATGVDDEIELDPVSEIGTPLKIFDVTDDRTLGRGGRTDGFGIHYLSNGVPTQWIWLSDRIVFNYPTDDQHWYRLEYYGLPAALTSASDVPVLPEAFHEPIGLFVVWIGLRRDQEYSAAYATKRDLQELMRDLRGQDDLELYREDAGFEVVA